MLLLTIQFWRSDRPMPCKLAPNARKWSSRSKPSRLFISPQDSFCATLHVLQRIPIQVFKQKKSCFNCHSLKKSPPRRKLPIYFRNDADFIAFMTFFSLSNGYLGNLCMIHGPKTTNSAELQETTAMVLVACLVLGTGSGSFISYPITTSI